MRAHRVLRQLADKLAEAGLHVLRFDYAGSGDSWGDARACTVASWESSVTAAYAELRDLAGVERVSAVGVRLGATLAAQVLGAVRGVRTLVLWDPVVDGAAYLAEMDALQQARVASFVAGGGAHQPALVADDTIMGFPFPESLRAGIRGMCLPPASGAHLPTRVTVLTSRDAAGARGLHADYQAKGVAATYCVQPDVGDWHDFRVVGGVMLASRMAQAAVAALRGVAT
jgi:pimeloyl-ACP methyl ester carboxylesterase